MSPAELLAQRQRDYAKAQDRHLCAIERRSAAEERVHALERELAEAEDADRIALGDSLVDGHKPPASEAEKLQAALERAKAEHVALQYACERAAQELDRMPQERRRDWLPKARADFQTARSEYEKALHHLTATRRRLAQEAESQGAAACPPGARTVGDAPLAAPQREGPAAAA